MNNHKLNLNTEANVRILVEKHYDKLLTSKLTLPIYSQIALPEHLTKLVAFWCSMLNIGNTEYKENIFTKHKSLKINKNHFELWLQFLYEVLDENFEGAEVEQLQFRANSISFSLMSKLELLED